MSFDPLLEDLAARRRAALKMGSEKRLAERAAAGILNARQRIEYLLDAGSFRELGLLSTAIRPEVRNKCPADGKISGFGSIADRPVALVSNDFTSLGASSSVVNGKKIRHAKELATRHGMPLILLGESSRARLPDRMGAQGRATMGSDPAEYLRDRTTPWLSALLGSCYGSSTWYACLSDIVVMRKGATHVGCKRPRDQGRRRPAGRSGGARRLAHARDDGGPCRSRRRYRQAGARRDLALTLLPAETQRRGAPHR